MFFDVVIASGVLVAALAGVVAVVHLLSRFFQERRGSCRRCQGGTKTISAFPRTDLLPTMHRFVVAPLRLCAQCKRAESTEEFLCERCGDRIGGVYEYDPSYEERDLILVTLRVECLRCKTVKIQHLMVINTLASARWRTTHEKLEQILERVNKIQLEEGTTE